MPLFLDEMSNGTSAAFAAWPERLVLVDPGTRIAYPGKPGPWGFSPEEAEASLVAWLEGRSCAERAPTQFAVKDAQELLITSRAQWRAWLAEHHATSGPIWLVTYKKASGKPRITYDEIVEEALCFGWIDSRSGTVDDERSKLWLAPRKRGSGWSRLNKQRVERLLAAGLIEEPGLRVIEAAQADGSWAALDEIEDCIVPDDLGEALAAMPPAPAEWESFSPRRGRESCGGSRARSGRRRGRSASPRRRSSPHAGSRRTSGRVRAERPGKRSDRSSTAEKACSTAVAPAGSAILRSGWRYWPLDPASTPALVSRALQPGDRRCRRPSTNEGTDHENVVYSRGRLSPAGDGRANAARGTIGARDRQGRGGVGRQAPVRAEAPGTPPVADTADQSPQAVVAV